MSVHALITKSFEYHLAAASLGHANAQNDVGRFYENGIGVAKDVKKAIDYYKQAADQGNASAADSLKRLQTEPKQAAPKRVCPDHLLKELDELVGLGAIRTALPQLLDQAPRYLLFTGNSGTGKTTAARFLGRLYRELGLLSTDKLVEVSAASLSNRKIKDAQGGILLIRDADKPSSNAFHSLFPKGDPNMLVIAVCSPGTEKRVTTGTSMFRETIAFPDYTPQELLEIFHHLSRPYNTVIPPEAYALAERQIIAAERCKNTHFRNAYEVADILEHLLLVHGSQRDYYRFLSSIHDR